MKIPCSVTGCVKDAHSRGLCGTHYAQARRSGSLKRKIAERQIPYGMSISDALNYLSEPITETGCHIWTGRMAGNGSYGVIKYMNISEGAHRFAYRHYFGEIPSGMEICHKCDIGFCINPRHLFLGTHADNMRDMAEKGRSNKQRGESASSSKLKDEQVRAIINDGNTYRDIAKRYGVSSSVISNIKNKKTWVHISSASEQPI